MFVAITSCVHLGHMECREDLFDAFIDSVIKHDAELLVIGDLLECGGFSGTKHVGSTWDQAYSPNEQFNRAIKKLKRVRPAKRKMMVKGNHEDRIKKAVGLDLNEKIAAALDMPYSPDYAVVNCGGKKIFVAHGCAKNDFDKVIKGHVGLDIIALGHTHELNHSVIVRRDGDVRRRVDLIRCGTFLEEPRYGKMALYPPNPIGAAWIHIDGHGVPTVDLNVVPRNA